MSHVVNIQSKSIRFTKNSKLSARALAALSAAVGMFGLSAAGFADTFSNNGGANLSLSGSWVDDTSPANGDVVPGAADIAQFDNLDGSTSVFNLGQTSTSWLGLNVLNPAQGVTIDDTGLETTNTLTLGASGINVGAAGLTINDSINVGASQTWSVASGQSLVVNGIVTGSGNTLTFTGAGNSVLTGSSAYTGTVATNNANLTLNYAAAGATTGNILNSGSTLLLGGGNFTVNAGAAAVSQTLVNTTVSASQTNINLTSSGGGTPTLNLGTLSLSTTPGAYVILNGLNTSTNATGATVTPVNAIGTLTVAYSTNTPGTAALAANGFLVATQAPAQTNTGNGAFATVGLYDWAAVIGTLGAYQVVGGSTVSNFYTPFGSTLTFAYVGGNVTGTASQISNNFGGNADIVGNATTHNTDTFASIRFNAPGTVLVNGVPTITLAVSSVTDADGMLVTPNVGASNILINGTANDFEAGSRNAGGGSEFILYQNNTLGFVTFSTGLANSKTGSSSYTQVGAGAVVFSAPSTLEGSSYLEGGMTEISSNSAIGGGTDAIIIQGGGLMASQSLALDNGGGAGPRPINLGAVGGTLAAIAGSTMNVDGVVGGTGALNIGVAALVGTGANTANTAAFVGSGTVQLSGANTYVGNTVINYGALRVDATTTETGTNQVTINANGGLVGIGTVGGNVVSSGTIIPGDIGVNGNVGVLSIGGNLALKSGSDSVFNTSASGSSEIAVGGTLTINPGSGVTLYDPNSSNPLNINGMYDLFAGSSLLNPQNLTVLDPATNAGTHQPLTYSFANVSGFIALTVTGGPAVSGWNIPGNGSWGNPADWSGPVPHNPGDIATLGPVGSGPILITLDAPAFPAIVPTGVYSMGILNFNNSNGYTVAVGTGGSMAFDQGSLTTTSTVTDSVGTQALNVPIALNSNTAVTVSRSQDTLTFGGVVSGAGSLTVNGPGTVNLLGSNAYTGVTAINSGTVQVGDGTVAHNSNLGSGGATITNFGTVIFNNTNTVTLFGSVLGTGTITQAGSGKLVFAGAASTFSGPLNVNGGSIQLTAENAIGNPSAVTFNNPALLDLNGFDQTLNNVTDNNAPGKTVIDNVAGGAASTSTLTINNTTNQTFSGVIQNTSGTVNLVVNGTGILALANSNSFTGTTTINGGGLQLNANNSLNPTSVITVTSLNGLNLGNNVTIANPISVSDSANEFETTGSGSATLTGPITVVGSSQFRPGNNNGTITFTNTIAASGDQIFVEGQTNLAGTAVMTGTATGLNSIGRSANPAALTLMNSASFTAAQTAGGAVTNTGFFLGDDDSTSGENSSVTLTIQDSAVMNLGTSALDLDSDPNPNGQSTINLNGGSLSLANFVKSTATSAQINLNGTIITATASDYANGPAGTAVFFPSLSNLTATIGTGGFILNNGGFNITVAQSLGGQNNPNDGGVTVSGAGGTVTLTSDNSYDGPTTVNGGTLAIANNQGALPSSTSGIVITAGSLQFAKGIAPSNNPINLSASQVPVITGGTMDVTDNTVIINYSGSADPVGAVFSYLAEGSHAGWVGAGISSSVVAADNASQSSLIYALGYADGADGVVSGLNSGQIEILPTLAGDAKLAGNVNFGDFQLLAANFGLSAGWDGGNFSYGSVVNFGDFQLLAQNFGDTNSQLGSGELASLNNFAAAFGEKLVANSSGTGYSLAVVPEPASIGLLAAGGLSLLARRRRKASR